MEKQFGKGKQAHLLHCIMNSNDCGPIIVSPNSLPNSRGQSINMRVHK